MAIFQDLNCKAPQFKNIFYKPVSKTDSCVFYLRLMFTVFYEYVNYNKFSLSYFTY